MSNSNKKISFFSTEWAQFGLFWSLGSVGWISLICLVVTWLISGFSHALFWFGVSMLSGAGIFALLLISIVRFVPKTESRESKVIVIYLIIWGLFFNLMIGSGAIYISLYL